MSTIDKNIIKKLQNVEQIKQQDVAKPLLSDDKYRLFPTARQYFKTQINCTVWEDGKCRDIQMRNIPDLGITGTVYSNPGCGQKYAGGAGGNLVMQGPNNGEWNNGGVTDSINKCYVGDDSSSPDDSIDGSTWQNGHGGKKTGRMRRTERKPGAFNADDAVDSVCKIRWIMREKGSQLSTVPACIDSTPGTDYRGDFANSRGTCSDDLAAYQSLGGTYHAITDLPYQYQNEFKLPLKYPDGGVHADITNNFSSGDQHQYNTCNPDIWNMNSSAEDQFIDRKTQFLRDAARYVLPTLQQLSDPVENFDTTPGNIDSKFSNGIWLKSYGYNATTPSGNPPAVGDEDSLYNGLVDNAYPGSREFINTVQGFQLAGDQTEYFNAFLQTFLNNAKTFLTTPAIVLDDDLYPSIKSSIQDLCGNGTLNSDGRGICRAFFKVSEGGICADIDKEDLVGENKDFAKYACSCNLDANQYNLNTPQQEPFACDNTCLVNSNNFPPLVYDDGVWQRDICTSIICIISNVDISIIDSSIEGGVEVSNLCGNNCDGGGCICYMDNTTVTVVNSVVTGGISIVQECGTCYEVQDGNYDTAIEVACDGTGTVSGTSTELTNFARKISDNRYWLLPLFASLFALALLGALIVMFIPKKVTQTGTTKIVYESLPTEQGYTYQDMESMVTTVEHPTFSQNQSTLNSSLNSLGMENTAVAPQSNVPTNPNGIPSRPMVPVPNANPVSTPEINPFTQPGFVN